MSYKTEEILRDAKGNPIPQYYSTDTERFEPLTDEILLTNSIVGYSTDKKPNGKKGDSFIELDTTDVYFHDGGVWVKFEFKDD